MRQTSFSYFGKVTKQFGCELLVGKRKSMRPLSTKKPLHLVLRSCLNAPFIPSNQSLRELIFKQARKHNITVYGHALNWNHIHLVIRIKSREDYVKFIRSLTATISLKVRSYLAKGESLMQSKHSAQTQSLEKLFTLRPFTRIIEWGRDFRNVLQYQIINQMQARGILFKKNCSAKRKDSRFEASS